MRQPDIKALEDAGLLERGTTLKQEPDDLDEVLGMTRDEDTDPLGVHAIADQD